MAPRTFHYFSTLPIADRELIWALAIRPERPSAHVFTIYNARNDTERALLSQHTAGPPPKWEGALAAPLIGTSEDEKDEEDTHEQQFSWVKGNRSAYMIDASLWTACRESRAVIERRFQVEEWERKLDKKYSIDVREFLPKAPATTWFLSGGEPQRCLTYPRTDLFFLRPLNADWDLMYGLPFSIGNRGVDYPVNHIALASDIVPSTWDGPGTECAAQLAAGKLWWLKNLWFVNYSLQRKVGVPPTPERRQFHGHDCVFTEVVDGDMDWCDRSGGHVDLYSFLYSLELEVIEILDDEDHPSPNYVVWDARNIGFKPRVGFLAYEEYTP